MVSVYIEVGDVFVVVENVFVIEIVKFDSFLVSYV